MKFTEFWMAPAGSEFMGKGSGGEMLCASKDGVEPALDLTGFLMGPDALDLGEPE